MECGAVQCCGVVWCCCRGPPHRAAGCNELDYTTETQRAPPAAARPATTTANVRFQFSGDTSNEYFSYLYILSPLWDDVQPGAGPRLCGGGLI